MLAILYNGDIQGSYSSNRLSRLGSVWQGGEGEVTVKGEGCASVGKEGRGKLQYKVKVVQVWARRGGGNYSIR